MEGGEKKTLFCQFCLVLSREEHFSLSQCSTKPDCMWQQTGWDPGIDKPTVLIPKAWKQKALVPSTNGLFLVEDLVVYSFRSSRSNPGKLSERPRSPPENDRMTCELWARWDRMMRSASVLVWTIGGCKLPKTSDVEIVWLAVKKHSWPSLNLQLDGYSCSSFVVASPLFLLINAAVGQISPLCTRALF